MKQLPIGIQSFSELRANDYLYIDKTQSIHDLIKNPKGYYFLSRPRRFGKSLLISTLEEIFAANKELFKGLWLEQSSYQWSKHPVIRIDFSKMPSSDMSTLSRSINERLADIATQYEVEVPPDVNISIYLSRLIIKLSQQYRTGVVILIDEYDSPIISNINHPEVLNDNRELLAGFYRTIKGSDEYLRFVFLTGVSKFAKVSVFSGLNNLRDITLDAEFATILGYTQEELESYFATQIAEMQGLNSLSREDLLENIRRWYNGYRFSKKDVRVYNPFSALLFFNKREFENYWFETGTPTFLLDLIKKHDYDIRELEGIKLGDEDFASYDVETMSLISLLYNTGYITIGGVERSPDLSYEYEMCYPNYEVRSAFLSSVAKHFTGYGRPINVYVNGLMQALSAADLARFIEILRTLFASIPYELEPKSKGIKYEAYYQSLLYAILKVTGMQTSAEERTNRGRVDLVVEGKEAIYLFEMKVDKSSEEAIAQIKRKGYAEKYRLSGKKLKLVGLSFSSTERNIAEYECEEI